MLSHINWTNENTDIKNCVIGSFDVDALYPSIEVNFAIEKCLEIILASDITFKGIDFAEIGLYLSLTVKKKELEKETSLVDHQQSPAAANTWNMKDVGTTGPNHYGEQQRK